MPAKRAKDSVKIGADIGGTFTDVVLETPARRHSTKLLTTYDSPERALLDGVALLLDEAGLAPADVGLIVHGTTLATNALIKRRGVKTALLTTQGFRDVLELGTESRFDQYLHRPHPPPAGGRRMTAILSALRMQVMWTRLISVVEEQAQTLMRTAFFTTVRDAGDLSAAVFDMRGRLVAEAVTGTPGHVDSMAEGVRRFLARFPPETMAEGDHYITNDPWPTAGHLHDVTVISPVFHRGRVTALLGGAATRSISADPARRRTAARSTRKGCRYRCRKLVSKGVVNADLMDILRQNVRTPLQVEGDVLSYVTSNAAGGRRL